MITIYKYPFEITDEQSLTVPNLAVFRHIGLDPAGQPCIWLEVDTDRETNTLPLFVIGTGHPKPTGAKKFLGSFNQGPFMWHVYTI